MRRRRQQPSIRRPQPGLRRTLDAFVASLYAALCKCGLVKRLEPIQTEDQGGCKRPTGRAPTGLAATGPDQESINAPAHNETTQRRANKPAAAVVRARTTPCRTPTPHGGKTENKQVTKLLNLLQKQNRLLTLLLCLFTLHSLLPFVTAQQSQPEQLIVFDEVGQMAASMAYVHVAIPLNISTYQHQVTLFEAFLSNLSSKTTDTPQEVAFTKTIRDLATFAFKRLHKLTEKLRFIDLVLPDDDLTQPLNSRQKRFLDFLFMPQIRSSIWRLANISINGDLYDSNCDPKQRPGTSDWTEIYRK